jgi:hypothetical protein
MFRNTAKKMRPQLQNAAENSTPSADFAAAVAAFISRRQRDTSVSMSSCIRCLYSSDQRAPGFISLWFREGEIGVSLISSGRFRAPGFSLSVRRETASLGIEFESFMQLSATS